MCEKFHQLLAVGRWFPPGTPVSSTRKMISSSFHRLDMTLAVAEALNPNKPNKTKNLECPFDFLYFDLGVTSRDLSRFFLVWGKWTLAQTLQVLEWCNLGKSELRVFILGFSIFSSA